MSILVLGGAGYIGSHTVYELIEKGYEVVVVDNLQTGHRKAVHKDAIFYEGDIRNKSFMDTVFKHEKISTIIHFAANLLVEESMREPLIYFNNNVYGTQVVLEKMQEYGIENIVFSSTAAVYGEPKEVPLKETSHTEPKNPYGESKLMMEKIMKWCNTAYGINYVALRYFNVAGDHSSGTIGEDHFPETHVLPLILEVAAGKRKEFMVFGTDYDTPDGTCIRDYVHVVDLAEAHILALEYLSNGGESRVFNVGSSKGFSVKKIIDVAREVTKKEIPVKFSDRRAGDPSELIASSERIRSELEWEPKYTDMETIISSAWKWHSLNPEGYGDRKH